MAAAATSPRTVLFIPNEITKETRRGNLSTVHGQTRFNVSCFIDIGTYLFSLPSKQISLLKWTVCKIRPD